MSRKEHTHSINYYAVDKLYNRNVPKKVQEFLRKTSEQKAVRKKKEDMPDE